MYNNDYLSALMTPTKDEEKWATAAKKAAETVSAKTPDKAPAKTSKLQDALSAVKTALTSDTGKGILKGLAATTAAAAIGGSSGVQALGGIMGKIKENNEAKRLEDIRKTKEKITEGRNQLSDDINRENLLAAKLKNQITQKEIKDGTAVSTAKSRLKSGRGSGSSSDKYGKVSEFDVAVEPKDYKTTATEFSQAVESGFIPKPLNSGPLTGPESSDPFESGMYSTDKKNVPMENKIKEMSDGAAWGKEFVEKNGLSDVGMEVYKQNQQMIAAELADPKNGLSKYQAEAAKREISRRMVPEHRAQERARQAGWNNEDDSSWGGGALGKIKDTLLKASPMIAGAATGFKTGAMMGTAAPIFGAATPIAGGVIGGLTGLAAGWGAGQKLAEMQPDIYGTDNKKTGQSSVVNTPAIAGTDITADGRKQIGFEIITRDGQGTYKAAETGFTPMDDAAIPENAGVKPDNLAVDMSLYSESAPVVDTILSRLEASGILTQEAFMTNLPSIRQFPEVASLPESEQVQALNQAFDSLQKPGRRLTPMPPEDNQLPLASARHAQGGAVPFMGNTTPPPNQTIPDLYRQEAQRQNDLFATRLSQPNKVPLQKPNPLELAAAIQNLKRRS